MRNIGIVMILFCLVLTGCANPNNQLGLTKVGYLFDQSNAPIPVQGVAHQTSGYPSSVNTAIFIQNKDGSVEKVAEASVGGKTVGLELADIAAKTAGSVFFGTTFGSTMRVSPADQTNVSQTNQGGNASQKGGSTMIPEVMHSEATSKGAVRLYAFAMI